MKILVVEDEPLIRLGIASLVEEAGYEVIEAANAGEAIAKLERDANVRLVLTDVDMPGGMDGIRLAHYVRDRWPPIKLIVISGKVGVRLSELPEGSRFFTKPAPESMLLSAVRELGGAPGET
jgi:CheY-like chemotaxis protein